MYNFAFIAIILSGIYGLHAAVGNFIDSQNEKNAHIERIVSDINANR